MTRVTAPVADEKFPIKAEYEFGSGKACLSLAFQLTSTMLMHIPYEMTSTAKSRMYELLSKNLADSFMVILTFFLAGNFFKLDMLMFLETILSCMYLYAANKTPPDTMTAPIKYCSDTAHASTPGASDARKLETYLTYCPEKMRATLAPSPNRGSTSVKRLNTSEQRRTMEGGNHIIQPHQRHHSNVGVENVQYFLASSTVVTSLAKPQKRSDATTLPHISAMT